MPIAEVHSGSPINAQIVQLILANDPIGGELLYRQYARGLSFLARRLSPEHAEDCLQDTLIRVMEQIKAGKLSTPAALPGYLATILKRTAWTRNLEGRKRAGDQDTFDTVLITYPDKRDGPSQQFEVKERARLIENGLRRLKPREREVLTRFYLQEQTPKAICAGMGLTGTQFRLLKCRSKQLLEKWITQAAHRPVFTERRAPIACVN